MRNIGPSVLILRGPIYHVQIYPVRNKKKLKSLDKTIICKFLLKLLLKMHYLTWDESIVLWHYDKVGESWTVKHIAFNILHKTWSRSMIDIFYSIKFKCQLSSSVSLGPPVSSANKMFPFKYSIGILSLSSTLCQKSTGGNQVHCKPIVNCGMDSLLNLIHSYKLLKKLYVHLLCEYCKICHYFVVFFYL